MVVDTAEPGGGQFSADVVSGGESLAMLPRSTVLLRIQR
jgi:hypothetical protein